jgi:hypothetical protein
MISLELSPDGYERIVDKIQSIEDIANQGLFDPASAHRQLQEVYGGLHELRQTLCEVCVLVPGTAGSRNPARRGRRYFTGGLV